MNIYFADEDLKRNCNDFARAKKLWGKQKAKKLINLCGKTTLSELVSIIYLIGGYLTVDSAPLHISLALGKNTFAVFGPTLPDKHLPKANNLWIFRKENLNCLGCYKRKCKKVDP